MIGLLVGKAGSDDFDVVSRLNFDSVNVALLPLAKDARGGSPLVVERHSDGSDSGELNPLGANISIADDCARLVVPVDDYRLDGRIMKR